jgi:Sigma-70 region 2
VSVAEDLTQETFLAAVAELEKGRRVEAPVRWIYGIARHKLLEHAPVLDPDAELGEKSACSAWMTPPEKSPTAGWNQESPSWTMAASQGSSAYKCSLLRDGKCGERLLRDAFEQVGNRGERQFRFRLGRPASKHLETTGVGPANGFSPDRRLADPGLALEQHDGEPLARRLDEAVHESELALAPEHRSHR